MARLIRAALRLELAALATVVMCTPAGAQLYQYRGAKRSRPTHRPVSSTNFNTHVTVELFTGSEGVGLQAQAWEPVFEKAEVTLRIRQGTSADKISVRQKQYGKLREVFVVGMLDRKGQIFVPGHRFSRSESAALQEWLRDLKTYGAQGNPSGKPLWGLNQKQFDEIFRALAAPVDRDVADLAFDEAILALKLPERYPFRLAYSAERVLASPGLKQRHSRLALRGLSRGTALAMLLSQYGLGFRPNRTPKGKLELRCFANAGIKSLWPVGWEPGAGESRVKIAPKLFQQTKVELKDQKLIDVLSAVSQRTSTPICIDYAAIEAHGLDLNSVLVSVPARRMTWSLLLANVTNPSFLQPLIRCDEMKKSFVWITPLKNAPARLGRRSRSPKRIGHASRRRSPTTVDPLSGD